MDIVQLPTILANKIAAGEVVERPSSVVKELIENSVDAKSRSIRIEVEEAGIHRIKIIDDGVGITEDNLDKAFLRHATSKIATEHDLFHIKTLGFRGEALSSIAAVSYLTIRSSTNGAIGHELKIHEGKIIERSKCAARQGTEVIVDQLFFNTPARLKHVKTIHTELGHITDIVNREALCHPHIRFQLLHNGKMIFQTSGNGNLLHVITQIYGREVGSNMLAIQGNDLDYHLEGFIAKPEITRANRSYMTLILNNRYVRNFRLNKAILDAYHTLLPIGRYPVVVLHVTMDPILIDVNVHPTKLEVRLSKEEELIDLVFRTIQEQLRQTMLIPNIQQEQIQKQHQSNQTKLDFTTEAPKQEVKESFYAYDDAHHLKIDQSNERQPVQENREKSDEMSGQLKEITDDKTDKLPHLSVIGQLQGTYILAQNDDGLYMIDQHAAQERIKYEAYKTKLGEPVKETQTLLIPLTLEFSNDEFLQLERYIEELGRVGIEIEPFGQSTMVVRSHPTWFPKEQTEHIIRDMIHYCLTNNEVHLEALREESAILMSCKHSIKANHHLDRTHMERLIDDLRRTDNPYTCPHGRPVVIHYSTYQIEKSFKRIM